MAPNSRAGRVLERLHRAIGKCVTFLAPKFPPDVARDVLRIKVHPIENDARCFHHIVAHAVARHPRNSVFSHRKATLSARFQPATPSYLQQFTAEVTEFTEEYLN